MLGFLGPNGAGKTTAMRSIFGLMRPDSGDVTWEGRKITPEDRRRFGYMPEERGLYPRMKAFDQLKYFGRLRGLGKTEAANAADNWLGRLGLAERHDTAIDALSNGNQQRVQLAVALVHDQNWRTVVRTDRLPCGPGPAVRRRSRRAAAAMRRPNAD